MPWSYAHAGGVSSVTFSPDSGTIACGCEDHSVRLHDARSSRTLSVKQGHAATVSVQGWVGG